MLYRILLFSEYSSGPHLVLVTLHVYNLYLHISFISHSSRLLKVWPIYYENGWLCHSRHHRMQTWYLDGQYLHNSINRISAPFAWQKQGSITMDHQTKTLVKKSSSIFKLQWTNNSDNSLSKIIFSVSFFVRRIVRINIIYNKMKFGYYKRIQRS